MRRLIIISIQVVAPFARSAVRSFILILVYVSSRKTNADRKATMFRKLTKPELDQLWERIVLAGDEIVKGGRKHQVVKVNGALERLDELRMRLRNHLAAIETERVTHEQKEA